MPASGPLAAPPAPAPARRWLAHLARSPRAARWALAALLAVYAAVVLKTAWVSDDAFITLRTVDNLVHGYGARWNVAERVQSYTHPLWFLVLSAGYAVTREPYYTTLAVSAVASVAAAWLLARRLRAPPARVAWALAALALSKAYVEYSTSGLENPLTHLLLVAFGILVLDDERRDDRRLAVLGLLAGLATLNRMDAAILFAPALALALLRDRRPRAVLAVAAGFLPFVAWEAIATVYYGAPYPNTALAKLSSGVPAGDLAAQGLRYLWNSLRWDPLTLAVIAAGAASAAMARRAAATALALGALLYVAYAVRIGGDFMTGRFLSAPFVVAVVLVATGPLAAAGWRRAAAWAVLLVLGIAPPRGPVRTGPRSDLAFASDLLDEHGIADERLFYLAGLGLFGGQEGWRRPFHATRGLELRRAAPPVAVEAGVGVIGYLAGPAVHVVDTLALGDPLLSRLPMVRPFPARGDGADAPRAISRTGWRIGHFTRNLPRGYLATLLSGENRIEDGRVARLYDRVALVTRGPIWSVERLRAIAALAVGGGAEPSLRERPAYEPVDWSGYVAVRPDVAEPRLQRARALLRRDAYAAALPDLGEALRLDPESFLALVDAGDALLNLRQPSPALALAERAAALRPEAPDGHDLVARCSWALGRRAEAIAAFERAAVRDRLVAPGAYARIGRIELEAGHVNEAVPWLRRATDAYPGLALAHRDLGTAYQAGGDVASAVRHWTIAARLGDARARDELSRRGVTW